MKARPRPDWHDPNNREMRLRVINDFVALRNAERSATQDYLAIAACMAAHEVFGAGEKRLLRFMEAYYNALRRLDKNCEADAAELNYREAENLGVAFLSDELKKDHENIERAISGTFLDPKYN